MPQKGKIIVTGQGEKLRQILQKELEKQRGTQRNSLSKANRRLNNYSQEHEILPNDMLKNKEIDKIPEIMKTEHIEIREGPTMKFGNLGLGEKYPMSPVSNKNSVYSKQRHQINDSSAYTISKVEEPIPDADFMFNLKVRVPKVKVSSYFKQKYDIYNRKHIKSNNSQFISNSSTEKANQLEGNYDFPESVHMNKEHEKVTSSHDGQISSRVTQNIGN